MILIGKTILRFFFNEKPFSEPMSEHVVYTLIYGIIQNYHEDTEDSSDEEPMEKERC